MVSDRPRLLDRRPTQSNPSDTERECDLLALLCFPVARRPRHQCNFGLYEEGITRLEGQRTEWGHPSAIARSAKPSDGDFVIRGISDVESMDVGTCLALLPEIEFLVADDQLGLLLGFVLGFVA